MPLISDVTAFLTSSHAIVGLALRSCEPDLLLDGALYACVDQYRRLEGGKDRPDCLDGSVPGLTIVPVHSTTTSRCTSHHKPQRLGTAETRGP